MCFDNNESCHCNKIAFKFVLSGVLQRFSLMKLIFFQCLCEFSMTKTSNEGPTNLSPTPHFSSLAFTPVFAFILKKYAVDSKTFNELNSSEFHKV